MIEEVYHQYKEKTDFKNELDEFVNHHSKQSENLNQ